MKIKGGRKYTEGIKLQGGNDADEVDDWRRKLEGDYDQATNQQQTNDTAPARD